MNKKHVLMAVLFLLLSLSLLACAWFYTSLKHEDNVRGKYMFANTRDNINYLGYINISSPENGEINIYHWEDGSWRFQEANDYYTNDDVLASFFNMIRNSIVISSIGADGASLEKNDLEGEKAINIKTYDYNGKLLDDVVLGRKIGDQGIVMARRSNNNRYIYTISSAANFPTSARDWLPYPLLHINPNEIKAVTINGHKFNRDDLDRLMRFSSSWKNFARTLDFLDYNGLTLKSDLKHLPEDTKVRQIDVSVYGGLIYKLVVLNVDAEYWVIISLDAPKVFLPKAVEVATKSYKYYSDWFFKLSDEQGKYLFDDILLN